MKIFFITVFLFPFQLAFSQGGNWTWINGTNTLGSNGVFGTQGVPSPGNYPSASYEYIHWKDNQGNFWIYGGCNPPRSDLWKYDPVTNEWTWVKGTGLANQPSYYGTKGVGNIANTPGMREWGAASVVDTSGNLWLFGGSNHNDLWKYDISTNVWTWMKW